MPKEDILVVQGDWNAKIGGDASKNWKGRCDLYCNLETNERGLRLLEFAIYNNLKGEHVWSTHTIRMQDMAQPRRRIPQSYQLHQGQTTLLVKCEHCKDRRFPGADIGRDHELVMMTFRVHLRRMKNQGNVRIQFSLEKLKEPNIAEIFQAMVGESLLRSSFLTTKTLK